VIAILAAIAGGCTPQDSGSSPGDLLDSSDDGSCECELSVEQFRGSCDRALGTDAAG